MFSTIKRLTGNITVETKGSEIFVEGVDAEVMAKDIKAIWGTNKLNQQMFSRMWRSSFSFPSFFAPDVLYTLERLTQHNTLKLSIRTLNKIREHLLSDTWLAKTQLPIVPRLDKNKLKSLKYEPLDFQYEFFDEYERLTQHYGLNGLLLAASAGSGKTYTSLALSEMLNSKRVVVIAPNNALNRVWEASLQEHFYKPPTYWLSNSGKPFQGNERFVVANYEALDKVLEIVKKIGTENVTIILDESHNFSSLDAKRTQNFIELCAVTQSKNVVWLSGTPIKALSIEAIPLFRCIDPLFNEDVQTRFKKIYSGSNERAVEILKNRMGLVSFKVEKSRLNLLEPIFQEIKVNIPNAKEYTLTSIRKQMQDFVKERHEYYRARKPDDEAFFYRCLKLHKDSLFDDKQKREFEQYETFLKLVIKSSGDFSAKDFMVYCNKYELNKILPSLPQNLRNTFKDVRSIVKYVHLKIQGECLGRIVGGARIKCHVDMVNSLPFKEICESTKKKTVVFTSFTHVIAQCERHLPEIGLSPLSVYGKTNSNLPAIIEQFDKDDNVNPLLATYASLSTAVPLTMADTVIMIDAPFRDYVLQQAVSRVHRIGATTQCYVYTASLDTGNEVNISTRSVDILKWSQQQIEEILGIKSPFEITDDLETFSVAVEGLDQPVVSVKKAVPVFMNW